MSMSQGWIEALLIIGLLLFAYPFVLYPALLRMIMFRMPVPAGNSNEGDQFPPIVMVICALNEQNIIRKKIENSLQLDYPSGRLRIVVVSDGSTDATTEIVRGYSNRHVQLIERTHRMGKIANLNQIVPLLNEEIVVLSDANVIYDREALTYLIRPFADESIGCVSGKVILIETTNDLNRGEQNYYSIEWTLQEGASRIHSMVGADGAMYAIRRDLFSKAPNDTLIEDLVIPIAVVRKGKRVIFQPKAVAWERGPATLKEEFRRKVRIAAGAAQSLVRGNGWPVGAPLQFWFVWLSHKLLRWLSPVIGLLTFSIAAVSRDLLLSRIVLFGVIVLLFLALVRTLTHSQRVLFNWPYYFVFGQVALLVGFVKGLLGMQSVLWAKASR
jgi:cellulose synthase/poly-beta-1,6-N-acetylglucosamine synthase-like glycosyltransferase